MATWLVSPHDPEPNVLPLGAVPGPHQLPMQRLVRVLKQNTHGTTFRKVQRSFTTNRGRSLVSPLVSASLPVGYSKANGWAAGKPACSADFNLLHRPIRNPQTAPELDRTAK